MRAVEKNQWLINVPEPLGRGHIVSNRRIKSSEVAVVGKYKCIRVLGFAYGRFFAQFIDFFSQFKIVINVTALTKDFLK
jgi:hypothetical protein